MKTKRVTKVRVVRSTAVARPSSRVAKVKKSVSPRPSQRKRELIADRVGATGTRELSRSATSSIP
jgi:hypothetical protein